MESLLQNPTAGDIETTLTKGLDEANSRARTRTVSSHQVEGWPARIAAQPEGILAADGGSVPNSYKYAAETTDVVVSWWTDGRGRKTVRITTSRGRANHTRYGSGRGTATPRDSAWEWTFPRRASKLSNRRAERTAQLLDRIGPEGSDDRLLIGTWARHLGAAAPNGLLIADHATRPKVVQVVVRDSTTGQRHHITVPPKFATPASKTYQRLGSSAARVHAAVAWTFSLEPAAYAPSVEA